jgi:hypothetical protein
MKPSNCKLIFVDEIIKNYTNTGGKNENLERTKTFLQDSFLSGTATCLICISRIKRDSAVCILYIHVIN